VVTETAKIRILKIVASFRLEKIKSEAKKLEKKE
jgi:hypothetical protein